MREIRTSGSEGGEAELNRPSLPLSYWSRLLQGGRLFRRRLVVELLPFRLLFGREKIEGAAEIVVEQLVSKLIYLPPLGPAQS